MEIHPNFSTNIDNRSNISTALKGARSEERLDSGTMTIDEYERNVIESIE